MASGDIPDAAPAGPRSFMPRIRSCTLRCFSPFPTMCSKFLQLILSTGLCFSAFTTAKAQIIDFEDLTTRNSFLALGIIDTYRGYEWGYGLTGGLANRTFVNPTGAPFGWGSATAASEAVLGSPEPLGLGGTSYAWNFTGPQSLWIDFRSNVDFLQGSFAYGSLGYAFNSSSVQLFGYNTTNTLVGSSAVLTLTDTFTALQAGFTDIRYLEIRGSAFFTVFSIDNLTFGRAPVAAVPEPSTYGLIGSALLVGVIALRRRSNREVPPNCRTPPSAKFDPFQPPRSEVNPPS
jgi:PEP-CTERM motif